MPAADQSARTRRRALGAVVRVGVRMQRRSCRRSRRAAAGPGLLAAGDRVTAAEAAGGRTERALDRGDDGELHAAGVGDHGRRRQRARERRDERSDRADRGRDHDQIDVAARARGVTLGAVDGAAAARDAQVLRRAPEADDLADDAALAERETEGRADQADAGDQQPVGDRFHGDAASRTAVSDSAKRWFSAGVPTVTRKWRGKPYTSIGRTMTPRRRSAS